MPDIELSIAHEAAAIGENLISAYHPHLSDASQVQVLYLFTTQKRKTHGKATLAATKRLSPLDTFLAGDALLPETGDAFLVLIGLVEWSVLTEDQRIALVDHELCHIIHDGEQFGLIGHDVEEFSAVIRRHGLWKPDVQDFARAVGPQLALFEATA
jgi:Putative phage metallopeptidase